MFIFNVFYAGFQKMTHFVDSGNITCAEKGGSPPAAPSCVQHTLKTSASIVLVRQCACERVLFQRFLTSQLICSRRHLSLVHREHHVQRTRPLVCSVIDSILLVFFILQSYCMHYGITCLLVCFSVLNVTALHWSQMVQLLRYLYCR